jgi:hypothetical protein
MKKKILSILLILLSLISFSYVYTSGNNVISKGDSISIYGYDEKNVMMNVYQITNPEEFYVENKSLIELKKEFKYSRYIKLDQSGNIEDKEKFNDYGLFVIEFKNSNNKTISNSIIQVSDINFLYTYVKNNLIIYNYNQKTSSKEITDIILIDKNGISREYKNNEKLNINYKNLKKIIIKKGNQYSYNNVYTYEEKIINDPFILILDKNLYKPDNYINFNIYSFQSIDGSYHLNNNSEFNIKIIDPANNKIYDKDLNIDDYNGINDTYYISESAPIGYYTIEITDKKSKLKQYKGFYVQEYIKPEFEINLESEKNEYYSGDMINYLVRMKYYNGTPVKNTQIAYYIYATNKYNYSERLVYNGVNYTNEKGILKIPVKIKDDEQDSYYRIQIITMDQNQRQMEKEYEVTVFNGIYRLEFKSNNRTFIPNTEYQINGILKDKNNNLIDEKMKIKIIKDKKILEEKEINTSEGLFSYNLIFNDEGYYQLQYKINNEIKKYDYYIYDSKYNSPFEIINKSYKNNILSFDINIKDGAEGLISIAGQKLIKLEEINIKNNKLKVKIDENIIDKNIYINGYIFYNGKIYRMNDTIQIKNFDDYKLKSSIKLEKSEYKPKENIKIYINSETESYLTLNTIDKALLDIYKNDTNIFDQIYKSVYSTPYNISSRTEYIYIPYYSELKLEQTHKFASYKGSSEMKNNTREYFPDTALWIPSIKLNSGENIIEFKNPDNLTQWIINAYLFSENKFNKLETTYKTNLDFYIRPLLPKYFINDDNIKINIIVYNNTKEEKNIKYENLFDEKYFIIDKKDGEINIQPNSQLDVELNVKAIKIGKSNIVFKYMYNDKDGDIVKLPVEILNTELKNDVIDIVDTKNGYNVKNGESYRKLNINNTIEDLIKYVENYEYTCSEQTISTTYPLIIASNKGIKINELDNKVTKAIQRLYKYQRDDGGWGWWGTSQNSYPNLSAYVLEGLKVMKENNYYISDTMINDGLNYLKNNIENGYISYVLKLYGIDNNYNPKNTFDKLYLSLYDGSYIEDILNEIKETEELAYIKIEDKDFYYSDIDYNAILYKTLNKNGIEKYNTKLLKYLLMNRYGKVWFSTKENAKLLEILIDVYDFNNEYEEFKKANTETYLKDGIYEIKKEIKINKNTSNKGIILNKQIYKRNEIFTEYDNKKNIIDAFYNINDNYKPFIIKYNNYKNKIEKGDYTYWEPSNLSEEIKYDNYSIYYDYNNNKLKIKNLEFKNPIKFMIKNKLLIIQTYEKIYEVNLDFDSLKSYKKDILDFTINNKKPVYLLNKEKDQFIIIDEKYLKINTEEEAIHIDSLNNNIYIFTKNKLYQLKDSNLVLIQNISAEKILKNDKNVKLELFGNIKFEGNETYTGGRGEYYIEYDKNDKKINLNDIIKIKINIQSDISNYLITEDYLPGNIQILKNYQEKNDMGNSKFYSYWYMPWNYWYTAIEYRKDKIAFFSDYYNSGTFSYYLKFTHPGKITIPGSYSYNMYWQGTYGATLDLELNIYE